MKITEVKEHSTEELKTMLEDSRRKAFDLRSQAVTEKLEDPSMLKKTKRDIARILMILRERELQAK